VNRSQKLLNGQTGSHRTCLVRGKLCTFVLVPTSAICRFTRTLLKTCGHGHSMSYKMSTTHSGNSGSVSCTW
jgi:hypothetical protein